MFEREVLDLSLEAFVTWLCEHSQVCVGLLGSWLCSPLVVWLSDACGSACWIDAQCFGRLSSPVRVCLPDWARLFLLRTDLYGGFVEATGTEVFDILADLEWSSLVTGGRYEQVSASLC
jgi:hypothetical protein